jgi:ribose/xylose/arabinose/galactoside ABC-type transport system permease subunit
METMKKIFSIPEILILSMIIFLVIFFQVQNPQFLALENIIVILRASSFTGLCAIGMAFLLISGMIDISIGSIAGLSSVVASTIFVASKGGILAGFCAGIACGIICGFMNSKLVLRAHLSPFLATISTMYIFRGLAMTISKGYTIYPLPQNVIDLGNSEPLGVSWAFWLFIVCLIIGEVILRRSVWGLTIKATGSDREIARWTEVNISRVTTQMFMLCGAFASIAGILLTTRVQAGQPSMGQGWELNAIAAVAIGGVSLSGYTGNMIGVFLGVMLIQILANGLVALGASAYLQPIEVGIILAIVASIDVKRRIALNLEEDKK